MRGIGQSEQSLTAMLGNAVFDIARGSGKGPSSDDAIKSCRVCLLAGCCCFCSASAADVIVLAPARFAFKPLHCLIEVVSSNARKEELFPLPVSHFLPPYCKPSRIVE